MSRTEVRGEGVDERVSDQASAAVGATVGYITSSQIACVAGLAERGNVRERI